MPAEDNGRYYGLTCVGVALCGCCDWLCGSFVTEYLVTDGGAPQSD